MPEPAAAPEVAVTARSEVSDQLTEAGDWAALAETTKAATKIAERSFTGKEVWRTGR